MLGTAQHHDRQRRLHEQRMQVLLLQVGLLARVLLAGQQFLAFAGAARQAHLRVDAGHQLA